ncbi:OsmC family protein [Peribacillus simplex]|uniref:OsmC family protein n=1 Tax=Peribacillus simplex TaxID=1478 RepID=UPI0011A1AD05
MRYPSSKNTEYLDTKIAIPTSLGGSGNGANPKEVLVASVTTCYAATLTFVLESRKLPVAELTVNSEASISDNEFKIIHYPHRRLFYVQIDWVRK